MTENKLKKLPLYDSHQKLEASFGQRGDWDVPLSYSGPIAEAALARSRAGVIDLSYLTRLRVSGDQMLDLMETVCTHDVAHQEDDTICDSVMLDENGGILAVCKVIRTQDDWLIICDAANREKILEHLKACAESMEVKVLDQTEKTAQISIVGTQAAEILKAALPEDPTAISEGCVKVKSLLLARYVAVRKNLGRLWGFDVIIPKMFAHKAWRFITQKAENNCIAPLGVLGWEILAAEEGVPRWGCELNQTIDPMTAGLVELVDMNHDFIGRPAIEKLLQTNCQRKRVGLMLDTQAPSDFAPMGSAVFNCEGLEVGNITSSSWSPTLEKIIAQAYVTTETASDKPAVAVELPGQSEPVKASIVELPFV